MVLECRGKLLRFNKPRIMGILNLTPDSFYDGGHYNNDQKYLLQVQKMLEEGADIIDIGAVSSKPGAQPISIDEEIQRLREPLLRITTKFPDIIISLDTYRSEVVKALADLPIHIVNDISGGHLDPTIIDTCIKYNLAYVMMHMQGEPSNMQVNPHYDNVVVDVLVSLRNRLHKYQNQGLNNIIIDYGLGFGKSIDHNYSLLKNTSVFRMLNCPILVGLSRKSMIYKVLHTTPEAALNGTTALNMMALLNGANILRVHDVKQAYETIKLYLQLKD